jgi:hypothetical protein
MAPHYRSNEPSRAGASRRALEKNLQSGQRRQDALNPQKYRYAQAFADLPEGNTHIVAIVLFRFSQDDDGKLNPNNYIVTAYMRELG